MEHKDYRFLNSYLMEHLHGKKEDLRDMKNSKDRQIREAHIDGYREAIDFLNYLCERYLLSE